MRLRVFLTIVFSTYNVQATAPYTASCYIESQTYGGFLIGSRVSDNTTISNLIEKLSPEYRSAAIKTCTQAVSGEILGVQVAIGNFLNGNQPSKSSLIWLPGVGTTQSYQNQVNCDTYYIKQNSSLTYWALQSTSIQGISKSSIMFSNGEYLVYGPISTAQDKSSIKQQFYFSIDSPLVGLWGTVDQLNTIKSLGFVNYDTSLCRKPQVFNNSQTQPTTNSSVITNSPDLVVDNLTKEVQVDSGISKEAVIGIVLGILVVIIVVSTILVYLCKRKRLNKVKPSKEENEQLETEVSLKPLFQIESALQDDSTTATTDINNLKTFSDIENQKLKTVQDEKMIITEQFLRQEQLQMTDQEILNVIEIAQELLKQNSSNDGETDSSLIVMQELQKTQLSSQNQTQNNENQDQDLMQFKSIDCQNDSLKFKSHVSPPDTYTETGKFKNLQGFGQANGVQEMNLTHKPSMSQNFRNVSSEIKSNTNYVVQDRLEQKSNLNYNSRNKKSQSKDKIDDQQLMELHSFKYKIRKPQKSVDSHSAYKQRLKNTCLIYQQKPTVEINSPNECAFDSQKSKKFDTKLSPTDRRVQCDGKPQIRYFRHGRYIVNGEGVIVASPPELQNAYPRPMNPASLLQLLKSDASKD